MAFDSIRVLLVEDNPGDARLLREVVREAEGAHIDLTHVDTLSKALLRLKGEQFDVVMLDLSLPDADGLETLANVPGLGLPTDQAPAGSCSSSPLVQPSALVNRPVL